jgi:hypothetical protein
MNPSPGFVVLEGNRSGHADDGVRRFPRGKQAELVRFEHPRTLIDRNASEGHLCFPGRSMSHAEQA